MSDDAAVAAVPDYCEPVIGWRMWNLGDAGDTLLLTSSLHTHWPHYEKLRAIHHAGYFDQYSGAHAGWGCDESPCKPSYPVPGCGIYCYKSDASLLSRMRIAGRRPVIVGRVALWGRVVEHTFGYRGQFAYPVSLHYAFNMDADVAAALAASYGIPYQEQPIWTSAQKSDDLFVNHYANPSPWQRQRFFLSTPAPITIIPHQRSGSIPPPLQPTTRPPSKNPLACEQPTFNAYRSIHWIWRHGTWIREEKDDDATP